MSPSSNPVTASEKVIVTGKAAVLFAVTGAPVTATVGPNAIENVEETAAAALPDASSTVDPIET
jgi:hypothetical protein